MSYCCVVVAVGFKIRSQSFLGLTSFLIIGSDVNIPQLSSFLFLNHIAAETISVAKHPTWSLNDRTAIELIYKEIVRELEKSTIYSTKIMLK
jgi:hypothetical protein